MLCGVAVRELTSARDRKVRRLLLRDNHELTRVVLSRPAFHIAVGHGSSGPSALSVNLWLNFLTAISWVAKWWSGTGTTMDSTAFQELIAQVRGTATALAEAEQKGRRGQGRIGADRPRSPTKC